jgi:hypothetical protein|tara:strand:+ start:328 stop:843 length:516 start_codon:yes stop_codon:yes gene_type:complete
MKIELKNIKVHLGLSEETHAYTAMLYVDGKKAVEVSNQGHGGGDYQYPVNGQSVEKINDWCENNLPKWSLSEAQGGGAVAGAMEKEFKTDLEMWCHNQVNDHLIMKDMKRGLASKALYVREGDGQLMQMGFRGVRKYNSRMSDVVRKESPGAVILNDLPLEDAFVLYKSHG